MRKSLNRKADGLFGRDKRNFKLPLIIALTILVLNPQTMLACNAASSNDDTVDQRDDRTTAEQLSKSATRALAEHRDESPKQQASSPAADTSRDTAPQDMQRPMVVFLDGKTAVDAYAGEAATPYLRSLNRLEMATKTGIRLEDGALEEQQELCRQRFAEAILPFSEEEKNALRQVIESLYPFLEENYSLIADMPWQFIKVDSSIEGGLPHTRDTYIVLSSRWLGQMLGRADKDKNEASLQSDVYYLLHEMLHVFQRLHPDMFAELYEQHLGFRRTETIQLDDWLKKHLLHNPDAITQSWIYPLGSPEKPKWIWPTLILQEPTGILGIFVRPNLSSDMRMVAVELAETGGTFKAKRLDGEKPGYEPLLEIAEFRLQFIFTPTPYHPDEIVADVFGRRASQGYIRFKSGIKEPAKKRQAADKKSAILAWFKEHLDE